MLNMKKGLAIVLAAATALTFAPVSTLGLQGVVEAQAADVSAVTSFNTVADQQIFGTAAKTVTVTENVTGEKSDTDNLNVESSDTGVATVSPTSATAIVGADGKTATADITVTGVKAGTSTITVTSGKDTGKKISFNVTVRENGELLSGKIDDSIYAVSGQTYDLVANDTQIVYGGYDKIFSGKELTWYLSPATDAVGADASMITTDKNIKGATFSESGVLAISNAADFKAYVTDKTPYLFGVTTVNGKSTVVYKSAAAFMVTGAAEKVQSYDITASCGVGTTTGNLTSSAFDNVRLPIGNGHYLTVADVTADSSATAKFDIPTKNSLFTVEGRDKATAWDDATASALGINELKGGKADYSLLNGTTITLRKNATTAGTYKATATLNYKYKNTDYVAVFNITVTVGQGPKIKIADGANVYGSTYDNTKPSGDPTIYLDLQNNKTFDIAKHTVSDTANTTYSYDSNSANVSVDKNGVITAKSVGTAAVSVKPTAAGVEGQTVTLSVRVNANGFDTLSVTGKDKDTAKVLSSKEFANNTVNSEKMLALRQINYVQIEVTGKESTNITEKPDVVSANKATLTYSFATQAYDGVKINPTTGEITIPYEHVGKDDKKALGVYAVKVVSAATNTSAQTVSYYYVVVDYPDLSLAGVADQYTVGVCTSHEKEVDPAIKFSDESKNALKVEPVDKDHDKFVGSDAYDKDDTSKFNTHLGLGIVDSAKADGQIMHVLVSNEQTATHGDTYKLVTIKSAPANDNFVTKIVNKDTGDVIYDATKDAAETAKKLIIEDTTNLQVTLHTPVAVSGSAVSLNIHRATDDGSVIDQDRYVTAVKNSNNIDVVLYPNQVGTQVISIAPGGHNSKTDRTDIHHKATLLAVVYNGVVAPAKVTGVKVANKKGAAVSVSWKSQGEKVLYRVYKKVGSGKWVAKNVKGTKTTLKVKKGAKVTIKVKAYKKTDAGKTVWGPKATQVSKKTDKK
jgi:hypothetical protein